MIETPDNAPVQSQPGQLETGLWLCWLSFLGLPLGLLAIGGGPCAGPRNAAGSAILLAVGTIGVGGGLSGIAKILWGIKTASIPLRVAGVLSAAVAGLASLVGGFYLFVGYQSLQVFLRD